MNDYDCENCGRCAKCCALANAAYQHVAADRDRLREALRKVRRNIERDHAKCCAKTHLGIGCLWCETVVVIDAALAGKEQKP